MYIYIHEVMQHHPTIIDLVPACDCSHSHMFTVVSFTVQIWQTGMMQEYGVHRVSRNILLDSTVSVILQNVLAKCYIWLEGWWIRCFLYSADWIDVVSLSVVGKKWLAQKTAIFTNSKKRTSSVFHKVVWWNFSGVVDKTQLLMLNFLRIWLLNIIEISSLLTGGKGKGVNFETVYTVANTQLVHKSLTTKASSVRDQLAPTVHKHACKSAKNTELQVNKDGWHT